MCLVRFGGIMKVEVIKYPNEQDLLWVKICS